MLAGLLVNTADAGRHFSVGGPRKVRVRLAQRHRSHCCKMNAKDMLMGVGIEGVDHKGFPQGRPSFFFCSDQDELV